MSPWWHYFACIAFGAVLGTCATVLVMSCCLINRGEPDHDQDPAG